MSSRELDELATNVDDASTIVEELQHEPDVDAHEKLDELHKTLEDASDTIDDLEDERTNGPRSETRDRLEVPAFRRARPLQRHAHGERPPGSRPSDVAWTL